MSDTPATCPDPELGSEGDTDQLPARTPSSSAASTTRSTRATPPERPRSNHYGETPWEEAHGETIDQRIVQEEPEVWEARPRPDRDSCAPAGSSRTTTRSTPVAPTTFAVDAGVSGGAASAEEAAVHIIEEEYVDDRRTGTTTTPERVSRSSRRPVQVVRRAARSRQRGPGASSSSAG